jgi:RimJ/RimL family protein N-acetyltransferase
MSILGKKVTLRAVEREDLDLLHLWSNDPDTQAQLGGWNFPPSRTVQDQWFERIQTDRLNQRFAIVTEDLGLIGTANLVDINWKDRNASHGLMLGDKDIRGKGYGVDIVMTVMRYAFEELGFERLDATIISYNAPSIKLFTEKCGWVIEGRKENWYWRKNQYWDKIMLGITRMQYAVLLESNNYWS